MSEKVRILPDASDRVETGVTRFGDDWPGVFIRGDDAAYFALALDTILLDMQGVDPADDLYTLAPCRELRRLLASIRLHPTEHTP